MSYHVIPCYTMSPSPVNWSPNQQDHLADLSSPFWSCYPCPAPWPKNSARASMNALYAVQCTNINYYTWHRKKLIELCVHLRWPCKINPVKWVSFFPNCAFTYCSFKKWNVYSLIHMFWCESNS